MCVRVSVCARECVCAIVCVLSLPSVRMLHERHVAISCDASIVHVHAYTCST